MLADQRYESADAVDHAHHVDANHPTPFVQPDIEQLRAVHRHAGIVHRDMQPAEFFHRRTSGRDNRLRIGHVHGYADRRHTQSLDRRTRGFKFVRLDIGQHEVHAGFRQRTSDAEANAGRRARHNRRLAAKILHAHRTASATLRAVWLNSNCRSSSVR